MLVVRLAEVAAAAAVVASGCVASGAVVTEVTNVPMLDFVELWLSMTVEITTRIAVCEP